MADEYMVGGGPRDGGMEARVSALEVDMKDVKATLSRLEISIARIDATLTALTTMVATKAEVAEVKGAINALTERVSAQEVRLTKVEIAINETIKSAVGKAIGPWQLPAVLAATGGVIVGMVAFLNWMAHQPWFGH